MINISSIPKIIMNMGHLEKQENWLPKVRGFLWKLSQLLQQKAKITVTKMPNITEAAWYPSTHAHNATVHTVAIHLRNAMSEMHLQISGDILNVYLTYLIFN
jgi:hypothetical protein